MKVVHSGQGRWKFGAIAFILTLLLYQGLERWAASLEVAPLEGVRSLMALAGVVGLVLAAGLGRRIGDWRRRPWSSTPGEVGRGDRRRHYALWFVELRWVAVAAIGASILLAVPILELLSYEVLARLLGWWLSLVVGNLLFRLWAKRGRHHAWQVFAQAVVDLVVLTGLLNASGGLENPFFIFYLFPVILAGILLPKRMALGVTAAALGLFLFLTIGEWVGLLPHVTNLAFPHALAESRVSLANHSHGEGTPVDGPADLHTEPHPEEQHASLEGAFVFARIAPFAAVLVLMALLTTMVMERLRRADEQLALKAKEAHHAARLAALGRMAAGIAHEVGNPLNSIRTRLSLLGRRGEDREYLRESVSVLQGQIDRIASIVHGVSRFGRSQQESWSTWEVNALVEEVVELVRLDRRSRSRRFVLRLPPSSSRVRGARDQISQVLLNLVLNAVEEDCENGDILVSASERQGWVEVSVCDHGPGIPAEDRLRLFEPFFTTKAKGSGLGLSISYSLVQAHGGELLLDEDFEGGSRFVLRLPASGGGDSEDS